MPDATVHAIDLDLDSMLGIIDWCYGFKPSLRDQMRAQVLVCLWVRWLGAR